MKLLAYWLNYLMITVLVILTALTSGFRSTAILRTIAVRILSGLRVGNSF